MIETCTSIALVLVILIYLQCKKWNMKKLYTNLPLSSMPLEDDQSAIYTDHNNNGNTNNNQQPLLHNKSHQHYYQTGMVCITINL